jgi:EpsD family peptidyl-prolyl cis-trans isomerase
LRTRATIVVAAVSAALALSGCDQVKKIAGGGKPTGQVVATVDGEEITSLQLRAELGNFGSRDPAIMKAAQQQALQRIILRKLLAKEAREMKLDKGTDYTLQVERGQETLLAQLYQRKLASQTSQPNRADAQAYVNAHPEMFANRRVFFVDQVIAAPSKIPPERLRPLKTMDEVKALLAAEGVQYQENAVVLDTLTGNPQLVKAILGLPPGEVFVIPQGNSLLFNQVTATRETPFIGDMAEAFAMNALRGQKAQDYVAKKITDLRKAAEPKITYNPAYKPPPPKAAVPPKSGATPANPPATPPASAPAAAEPAAK